MGPMKFFGLFWNVMAVIGLLVTLAMFGALLADFSSWVIDFFTTIFSNVQKAQ